MWSTNDPPDIIEGTSPFDDIEDTFSISISDDDAVELYDMDLDEAARKIMEIRNEQCQQVAASGSGKKSARNRVQRIDMGE